MSRWWPKRWRMSGRRWLSLALIVAGLSVAIAGVAGRGEVHRLDIDGPIGPATSDYVVRGIERAAADGAELVLLRIDTPGGLDTAMRDIVRAILNAPLPIVGFVAPSGAHAASAGTYILYASHIAAMAPGTNLGAATPVQVGAPGMPDGGQPADDRGRRPDGGDDAGTTGKSEGAPSSRSAPPTIGDKAVNDAVAYLRSLAQLRGRNVEWAEKAVLEAASLSADDALAQNVIDLIAPTEVDLLRRIDGRVVVINDRPRTLATEGVAVVVVEADWRTKLLSIITNPNVASLLMMIGIYGLILEFYSPGFVGPGVIGAVCLLLALYAFHVLPIDYGGLALVLLGLALMVAEAFTPSFGILGLGGLVAFVIGSIMLIDTDAPGFQPSWALIGPFAAAIGGMFALLMMFVMRSRRRPVVSGPERMMGSIGPVIDWQGGCGHVRVMGERWQARSPGPLNAGDRIRVVGIDGLTLDVEPAGDAGDVPEPNRRGEPS